MSVKFLKVKVKALAAEARIIRQEEVKLKGQDNALLRSQLCEHRRHTLRRAAREAQLAYGYLRGRTYLQLEPSGTKAKSSLPDWSNVFKMVKKYGSLVESEKKFEDEEWYQGKKLCIPTEEERLALAG